jgi:hypothetical protein
MILLFHKKKKKEEEEKDANPFPLLHQNDTMKANKILGARQWSVHSAVNYRESF